MRLAIALLLVPGCVWCEVDDELAIVDGTSTVHAGESVSLVLDSEGYHAGPDRCRGHWYVNGVERGNAELGTVTRCGVYTAPAAPLLASVRIEATHYVLDGCADCCPYGARTLRLAE